MAKDNLSTKLAIILHADVAGSTQLVQQDERLAHERIQDAFMRFSETIEKYHGRVRELRGDALLAGFELPSDAVTAALVFQADHASYIEQLGDDIRPTVRVGIAMGEVIIADNTVTGAGVVLAQRVEQLSEPGSVCITAAIHEGLPMRLPFDQADIGEQQVKGFDEPIRIYRVELKLGQALPQPDPSGYSEPTPLKRNTIIVTVAIALIVVGGSILWLKPWAPEEEPASLERMAFPVPGKPSIAVLPFSNLSGDPKQEYFSDGITNDIITDLSKFSSLYVIASSTIFTYKGKPVKTRDVAREIGVRYVLEGSVQRVGDKVRVNVQLIDAMPGHHLWAERYDRDLKGLFSLQDEIVQTIASTLAVKVSVAERERVAHKDTGSLEAYDYVLRGWSYHSRITRPYNMEARQLFQRAIELDSHFASAYVGLGHTYIADVAYGWTEFPAQALQQAHDFAQKALSFKESAAAHRVLGRVYLFWAEYDLAHQESERAIELNPNDWYSRTIQGTVMLYTSRTDEAIHTFETALRFNPNIGAVTLYELGIAYYIKGQYDDAIRTLKRNLGQNPNHIISHVPLAAAYAQLGRSEDASREAARVLRLHPLFEVASFGTGFRNPADRAIIADGLHKAGLE